MILRTDASGKMNDDVLFLFVIRCQPLFQIFNFYVNPSAAATAAVNSHIAGVCRISFHLPAALGKRFHAIISGTAPGHQFALDDDNQF